MGDPAGISPELAAKLIAAEDFRAGAGLVIFGDLRILEQGAKVAGVAVDVDVVGSEDGIPEQVSRPVFVDLKNLSPDQVKLATATLEQCREMANAALAAADPSAAREAARAVLA